MSVVFPKLLDKRKNTKFSSILYVDKAKTFYLR